MPPPTISPPPPLSPAEELHRVMREIVEALHGTGSALTLHPTDRAPEIVYVGGIPGLEQDVAQLLRSGALDLTRVTADEHLWVTWAFGSCAPHAITLPVREVAGHSRLLITVFFDTLAAERRAAAETAYLQRRPFAVGYFRLWQLERLQRRTVGALSAALDLVDIAIILLARAGTVAFANRAARRLFDAGDGLREQAGRLRAAKRADSIVLDASLGHVLGASGDPAALKRAPLFTVDREGRSPLIVSAMPAPEPTIEAGEIAAVLFAVDPDMDITELAAPVCRLFRLTPVETRLACALAAGAPLADAAARLRMKEATARTTLKGIFGKTGTNRQVDLVRLILMSLVHAAGNRAYEPVYRQAGLDS